MLGTIDRTFYETGKWILAAAIAAAIFIWVFGDSWLVRVPDCYFETITGLYCPGCGSTRAIRALLNGQIKQAFLFNPLLFILGPPSVFVVIYEYLRFVFPKMQLKPVILPWKLERVIVAIILVYWVLRNIPAFSVLAP